MNFFDYDYDNYCDNEDIIVPNYTKNLKSEKFNSLSIEQQNEELKQTVINLSNDFEKIVKITSFIQDDLNGMIKWVNNNLINTNNEINCIHENIKKHIDSTHTYLISSKEK